jgi:phosphoserine phosphatase RsbU/P
MRPRLSRLGAGALLGVLLIAGALSSLYAARTLRRGIPAWSTDQQADRIVVVRTSHDDLDAAVRVQDEIIAADGVGLSTIFDLRQAIERVPEGERLRLLLRRDGRLLERQVPLETTLWFAFSVVSGQAVSWLFLLCGVVVFLLRPEEKQAVLLALLFSLFPKIGVVSVPFAAPVAVRLLEVVSTSASVAFWPVFLHFFLVFPQRSRWLDRCPSAERWIYLPALGVLLPLVGTFSAASVLDPSWAFAFVRGVRSLELVYLAIASGSILLGLAGLVASFRRAERRDRRRLKVVVAGSLAGLLPMLAAVLVLVALGPSRLSRDTIRAIAVCVMVSLPLFPLSFAYAIVRHQVIPVRVILRRGVRYVLVSRGFALVQVLAVVGVIALLLSGHRAALIDSFGPRMDIVVTVVVGGLCAAGLGVLNRRIGGAIDRRFFRETYDSRRILSDLAEGVRQVALPGEVLSLAVRRIQDALHTEGVLAFLRDAASAGHRWSVHSPRAEGRAALATDAPRLWVLPDTDPLVERLRSSLLPISLDPPLPEKGVAKPSAVEAALREEGVALLLPLPVRQELIGVLALGPRLGDLPFSREDRELLRGVAWQVGLALDSARVAQRMAEEERLRYELTVASEVQRRLFPSEVPRLRRVNLAGACLPALEVGGDYYDFLMLGEGRLGIAVADVSGKGISAAIIMSIVQASLRSQLAAGQVPLSDLVASMNRLLLRSTAPNSFASFFYGQLDENTGHLAYVNAGLNPPLLFRAANGRPAERLWTGGLVIGAVAETEYRAEEVKLDPGDVLVAYTDGMTEAFDAEGRDFGEQRLEGAVAQALTLSAEAIRDQVLAKVQAFCGEAPQHDDMTLVVAKFGGAE